MPTPPQIRAAVESALSGPSPTTPAQRFDLFHTLRAAKPIVKGFLTRSPPQASARAQVQSKELLLPVSGGRVTLDDQDVQLAFTLSDELNLNEIDCVRLLVDANRVWNLSGREPAEILHIAAGIWYAERIDIIDTLYTLLRAVVLDLDLEDDLRAEISEFLEDLFQTGLRQQFITLIKELGREDGSVEFFLRDPKGALVDRKSVASRESLSLGHCLVLSVLFVRLSTKEAKEIFNLMKDSAIARHATTVYLAEQIFFSLLFSLVIAFTSDALSSDPLHSTLSQDASFKREFHELVMTVSNDPHIEGFIDAVRLSWLVYLLSTIDERYEKGAISGASTDDLTSIYACVERISSNNVFEFVVNNILRSVAFQNGDEDMLFVYHAYLHKLMMFFLSHPLARDKVKEMKEKAMDALGPFNTSINDPMDEADEHSQNVLSSRSQPFISILELLSEICRKEPELIAVSEELWTFIHFAGEDHRNFHTLVAFLGMLSALACSEEGALRVFELLERKTFRSIGWRTLFDCFSIYEQKFKQPPLQGSGALLPEIQEGDARALVAYLGVLQKVVENGNVLERKKWFPDIEPLFKLLSYENVPPYLKGALRNAIASFIQVAPIMKDAIWCYLEQYDLPIVVGSPANNGQQMSTRQQVYDMRCELNEVEARLERYPSTISFLNLLNALIAEEQDRSDRGCRFVGIFRFVYDHVFGPFPLRAYSDSCEKWQLVVACLKHFKLILTMYDVREEDIVGVGFHSQTVTNLSSDVQPPILELMKDFLSGKVVYRNIMGILILGVNALISERTDKVYGILLEKAVQISLEILVLVFEKDLMLADVWRPLYQSLDAIVSQDSNQIATLLDYVRYHLSPEIQRCSIKIMSIMSFRMVGLVQLLLQMKAGPRLIEGYAVCLAECSEGLQIAENARNDTGFLILQLLIDNIPRPAPNISHLLLNYNVDSPVERTVLNPRSRYSCLKVILDILEGLSKPDSNALLHELSFKLLYELCAESLTSRSTMELLSSRKYHFFSMHLDTICVAPLPKSHALRISSLHQRAWLLKLLSLALHAGDINERPLREACTNILFKIFGFDGGEGISDQDLSYTLLTNMEDSRNRIVSKNKVLEMLEIVQFKSPDVHFRYTPYVSDIKYNVEVEEILRNSTTADKGGVYRYSERGDRLIDLGVLPGKLWQRCNSLTPQRNNQSSEASLLDLKETIQQILRWGWKHNMNLEEQAAQLHMLLGWSQIVEIAVTRRMSFLENCSGILFGVLDASLSASASPDYSLKMAVKLTKVALTCLAKLRDERFSCPGDVVSNNATCLDAIMVKQLPIGACHSVLLKLVMAILRQDSSEMLRRSQYALFVSYFQYCHNVLHPDVPMSILQYVLPEDQAGDGDIDFQRVDEEQAELARANFSLLKKEADVILDVVIKDASEGSEAIKSFSLYVLDALVSIDKDKFFLSRLQSRGFLRDCFGNISNFSYQDSKHPLESLHRLYTREAEMALLLRISHHYKKAGAQVLFSMGILDHLAMCKISGLYVKVSQRRGDIGKAGRDYSVDVDKQRLIIPPVLRLVSSMTCLVDTSEFLEVKNKVVREIHNFINAHQALFDHILKEEVCEGDELTMELLTLVVDILTKVWLSVENDESGLVQGLFSLMRAIFQFEMDAHPVHSDLDKNHPDAFRLCFSLCSYLYFLVTKKFFRFRVSDASINEPARHLRPTLMSLVFLHRSATKTLERAVEENSVMLSKIQDINELSRQDVDEIINVHMLQNSVLPSDDIRKRRYTAMIAMCRACGDNQNLISLLLKLVQRILDITLIHFQDGMKDDRQDDVSALWENLLPSLERLELLNEDQVGHGLKILKRLVCSLKEMAIQKLSL